VKKVSFPREILALAAVGSACVFFVFQAVVMVIFMIVLHTAPDWSFFPVMILALITGIVLASALGVLLSSINVYLRDTQHLIEVILTAWFWACPIVYAYQQQIAEKLGPRGLTWVYFLNPMVPLVLSFQRFIYAHPTTYAWVNGKYTAFYVLPTKGMGWYVGLDLAVLFLSLCLFLVALATFGRLEGNFAEEL
jgi:ABC-2 type transport system permease protein